MQKRKRLFERIPMTQVPATAEVDTTERRTPAPAVKTNVQKRAARPKRSIKAQEDDHPLGLWMDVDLLCKHRNRPPQIVLHDELSSAASRYFMLADLALRKKSKSKHL